MRMRAFALAIVVIAGCSGGDDDGGGALAASRAASTTIPVVREDCTPFGSVPRAVVPLVDLVAQNLCLPGGRRLDGFVDGEGAPRHACLYDEAAPTPERKLPLVVWIHPSAVTAEISLLASDVRSRAATADLTGDPSRRGFVLLAPAGRTTNHFYPFPDDNAPGWDNWYRQLAPDGGARTVNGEVFPQNVDAEAIDHFVGRVLASGAIDEQRIYLMGWSNGSAMAILYALHRPFVAAAAVYSSPSPFAAFDDPCVQEPILGEPDDDRELRVFHPDVPILHVQNDCDVGGICPNGLFLRDVLAANGVTEIESLVLDSLLRPVDGCLAACGVDPLASPASLLEPAGYLETPAGYSLGLLNHLRWPLGWTDEMLAFLRDHRD